MGFFLLPFPKGRPCLLARFISQAASPGEILTAAKNVTNQPVTAEEAVVCLRERVVCMLVLLPLRSSQAGLDKGPASSDPVTVATVDQLVCAARKATFRCILP